MYAVDVPNVVDVGVGVGVGVDVFIIQLTTNIEYQISNIEYIYILYFII
jgi:hypothetical protein